MDFVCGWCCGKIHNNVWGTHRGGWFPARNFLYSSFENRYSIEKYIIFGWFELEFAYILCLGCAFFFQNQSWRLSLWKTYNNVGGATRGDYSAQRIFADSTFGRSLLLSKSAALQPPSCRIFLKSAGSILHVMCSKPYKSGKHFSLTKQDD